MKYNEWGASIVPIVKPFGEICICGDDKVTVNSYLRMERAEMPKIERLLMNIKMGGLNFITRNDCKSLASIFGPKKCILIIDCLQRYSIFFSKYDFKIEYVTSNRNSCWCFIKTTSKYTLGVSNEKSEVCYLQLIEKTKIINTILVQNGNY